MAISNDYIKNRAKYTLSKVHLGESWTDGKGVKHRELVLEGEVIGDIHDGVKLDYVEIDGHQETERGIKVFLFFNGSPVGHIWLM